VTLKCSDCGSRNTEVTKSKDFSDKTGASMAGTSGFVDPVIVVGALSALAALFKWLSKKEENNPSILACKDCGHWEKI